MILIITPKKRMAASLESIFRLRGLITMLCKPIQALHHINSSLSAILLFVPEELPDTKEYLKTLFSLCYRIPIFAITKERESIAQEEIFTDIIDMRDVSKNILETIHRGQSRKMMRLSGVYRFADIDASVTNKHVTLGDEPIPLTKTEKTILRYLISTHPSECPANQIRSAIYPIDRTPEPSCIRAHICAINRKFRRHLSFPLIISTRGAGYRIDREALLGK